MTDQSATIDGYIGSFPEDVQVILKEIRRTIRASVPEAEETISYQIPTFVLNGRHLVHFAGWKKHVALYPMPAVEGALADELAPYREAKSTARFPLNKPVPYGLIARLVGLLVEQRGGKQ